MAILIEEEKKNGISFLGIIGWFVLLLLILFLAYYVFFKKPEIISLELPKGATEFSNISLDPGRVVTRPDFAVRSSRITPRVPGSIGRNNPFLGF